MSISRMVVVLGTLLVAFAPGQSSAELPAPADAASVDRLRIEVSNLHSDRGFVYCALFAAPGDGFPADESKIKSGVRVSIKNRRAVCEFGGLAAGVYAVTMLHDENGNGRMDTTWMGIPAEGYGATRDAKGSFGPPKFKDAAFSYKGGGAVMRIQARYGVL